MRGSRRTVQVAQDDHGLARLGIDAKNRVHSRIAAAVCTQGHQRTAPILDSETTNSVISFLAWILKQE
jgi:hypothetical protein